MRAFARLLYHCVVRSRCPCCERGPLFAGWFALAPRCRECGLEFEQWYGDWITPTYLAGSVGLLTAISVIVARLLRPGWLAGIPTEGLALGAAVTVALLCLPASKALWLAVMWWIGGVEVSAETRAHLRWTAAGHRDPEALRLSQQAEERARALGREAAGPGVAGPPRGPGPQGDEATRLLR